MDRSGAGYVAAVDRGETEEASEAGYVALRVPAPDEVKEIEVDRGAAGALAALIHDADAEAVVFADGRLAFRFPGGGFMVIDQTKPLMHAFAGSPGALLDILERSSDHLMAVLADIAGGGDGTASLMSEIAELRPTSEAEADVDQPEAPDQSGSSPLQQANVGATVGHDLQSINSLAPETLRWGRDDLKRGEAGASGVLVDTPVGNPLAHMTGLGDEEVGHRNGEKLVSSDNQHFDGAVTDVGQGIGHLWLLGDYDYLRASGDQDFDELFAEERRPPSYAPIDVLEKADAIEDTPLTGQLFNPAVVVLPVVDRQVTIDPAFGTVTLAADGRFDYVPSQNFSGVATFTYSFTDPRTGIKIDGDVEITVAAVADLVLISGSAATVEDVKVAIPVDVSLIDTDGSEVIESVVISGVPAGAVLAWDTGLPGNVTSAGGTFTFTGTTDEIRALLQSLELTPPADLHGRITLDVAVTNAETGIPVTAAGYGDRQTQHYAYNIDVEADADLVTATGDSETTDEDVAVHLDNLAATFGDLVDGSETHTIEIRGVAAGARLQDALGNEYPVTIAGDGTRTYTLTNAQLGAVYFLPPPDESGTFTGMRIVAIATETSNGDSEIATAPIQVIVTPVADPVDITAPAQATDEDTAITIGDDIAIVVNDPLSQTLTEVTVSGFPAGATITYTPVGGGAVVTVVAVAGQSVTFTGGSEAEIRTALATLSFTPPVNSDANITLSVSATTEDTGGVSDTRVVPMPVTVAAVADVPALSGAASGNEDASIPLVITTSRVDTDGSESYDFASITLPAGVVLEYAPVLPNGITVSVSGTTTTFRPGPATTSAEFESFLATGLAVRAPADSDVNFNAGVTVGVIESTLSGGEVSLLRAEQTISVPVVVHPVIDMPTVGGSSTVDEDTSVNFGANITISANDASDGSEAITAIVLGAIPSSATVGYTVAGGASVAVATAAGVSTYTITGSEADIRATLASFTLQPALHTDADIAVTVAITKTDRTTTDPEAAATQTDTHTHNIAVAAVADGPLVFGSASGLEDQPINLPVTVSRIDADGSETYDFASFTPPPGVTLLYASVLPNGITVSVSGGMTTFTPGPATTAAQFENFLATGVRVQAPADSDVNFNVGVTVGTIESVLSGGQVTLLRAETTTSLPVTVRPVIDAPIISGSSLVNEDGIIAVSDQSVTAPVNFGANIAITAPDSTDGSEAITSIVVGALPVGAVVSYTPVGGGATVSFVVTAGTTTVTLTGGSEAEIRAALATMSLVPPANSDADITLTLAVTKSDATASEAEAAASSTFNATHTITVAAVADVPTGSGSASGFEDQNIPVSISVAHADASDGSERIRDVVIAGVPAGFTLTESSTGAGTLTLNLDGTYTVTGPNDAAIADVLAKLTLVIAPTGPRQHLDTDFSLSATVTTIESAPAGTQNALPTASTTFAVPVTVTAVADGVTHSGSSVLVEDVSRSIGSNIQYARIDNDGSESVVSVTVSGFLAGTTVSYTDVGGTPQSVTADGTTVLTFTGGSEAQIRAALDTLTVTAPLHSDTNFALSVSVTTNDNDGSSKVDTFAHAVVVQAVADAPTVSADDVTLNEDASIALVIRPDRSADDDGSETLSVRLTVPADAGGVIGTLTGTPSGGVTLTSLGGGVYLVQASGATAAIREAALDGFLNGGITFTPRAQWSGALTGTNGIKVEAISTEAASGYGVELAPNNSASSGTAGDLDTKIEIATTYIDVTVNADIDIPTLTNASTTVQENNNSTSASDPDLVVPIGTRLGMTLADTDGSQNLALTLTGFPTNAQALSFGSSIAGVTVSTNIATGTVTVSGANSNDVITVLNSLSVTLADDDDRNFTVTIDGSTSDSNGVTGGTSNFSLTHLVTVQAVADVPTVNRGAATKAAVAEDSGFVGYPVTVTLNDTDGSETLQSVRVDYSTAGSGADPVLRFTTSLGTTFDTATTGTFTIDGLTVVVQNLAGSVGRVTISGGMTAEIQAVIASLEARPGTDNGEDITVSIRATSVESNPAEDNNGAAAGLGGGVTGPEISVATATSTSSFTIPVNPVAEPFTLSVPASVTGVEDTTFALGTITVTSATDADGSETRYIEIDTSSYPTGTTFSSGGSTVGTIVTAGWLRIPEASLATLSVSPPANYSGVMNLTIRGVVVDASASGNVTSSTSTQVVPVTVTPVADPVSIPAASVGVEDEAAIALGTDLLTALAPADNGSGTGNNAETETITQIVLDFPDDTATVTYNITPGAVVGSAQIVFDPVARSYTITSSILAAVGTFSTAERAQAEADIRATLAGFTVDMGPTHSDANGVVAVKVTTLDGVNLSGSTLETSFNHTIVVQAVADTPGVTVVDPSSPVSEDATSVALQINVANSADTDGSETLSVRITVPKDSIGPVGTISGTPPAGVTMTSLGGGAYLVTASGADAATREALLDSFLNGGGVAFVPRANWSGVLTDTAGIRVDVISTEAATGSELADGSHGGADGTSKTETVTDWIDIRVGPVADAPSVKGNGIGAEDTLIKIPVTVTLADRDGSETYEMRITAVVPPTTKLYGAGGAEILPDGSGVYHLTPADVAALTILPPEHYSSALSGDIVLTAETIVTDTSGGTTSVASFTQDIHVAVTGVADAPGVRSVSVAANEDEPIALGAAIVASTGGNINSLLVDTDGSETLYFVVGGLPQGVIPTSSVPGGVIYMGSGTWSVSAAAMATLELPAVPNFSGVNPYAGVTVRVVTQEIDGDDASSPQWPVTISVSPVINAATVDGFASWSMGVTQTEAVSEAGGGISLASVANHAYVDNDGSESVVSYTFDLSNMIADAGLAARLVALEGAGAGLDELVAGYISGTFTYDAGAGTITIAAADIGGVALSGALFLDSNDDFSLPVSALVRDQADLSGTIVSVDKVENGIFSVNLVGTADVPTVFATSVLGTSGQELAISLGGTSTDTDASLGRSGSEDIYYIVSVQNPGTAPLLGFTDGAGHVVGLDNGDGTWLLSPADLANLHVLTPSGSTGVANLTLTTIAVENDGDRASNTTNFTVEVTAGSGPGGGPAPLPPSVSIGTNAGNEDGSITLNVTATPAPGDSTNPSVAVMISDLPAGATVVGARYNPVTGRYVASAADVIAGNVQIIPPIDFSGPLDITIEAVAINASLQQATTGETTVTVAVDPVADGVAISASPGAGLEDTAVALGISLAERDIDGSEDIGGSVYVRLSDGATLVGAYAVVASGDADATIPGTSTVGYYRVPAADVATLQMLPAANWHGDVSVAVIATSIEPTDDNDGDNIAVSSSNFVVSVEAVADAPLVSAPVSVSGNEDASIAITGLSAALADAVTTNGAEVLSVIISGVPAGSRFSAGSNNGDGSWTIPVADLATLSITPPSNYAGTMTLTLTAIALELVNGDEANTSVNIDVIVAPLADEVLINADNVTVDASASAALSLSVRMADDNGTEPGELPPETITITFSGVPDGVSFAANSGGTLSSPSAGVWQFVGTEAQANALVAEVGAGASAGTHVISLSAITTDGASVLSTPVTDSFQLYIPNMIAGTTAGEALSGTSATDLMFGLDGNDTLQGGGGADHIDGGIGVDQIDGGSGNDVIRGGAGGDQLTGGTGSDTFLYETGDVGSGVDVITDFTSGPGGDVLDIEALLVGYSAGTSVIGEFVSLVQSGGDTTVRLDANGGGDSFVDLVVLANVTGLDVNTMQVNGNLIV